MSNRYVQLFVLLIWALLAPAPVMRGPSEIEVLQHQISDVSDRVHVALDRLDRAHTAAEKSRANAQLVDLRLELADLSDRVRMQSPQ